MKKQRITYKYSTLQFGDIYMAGPVAIAGGEPLE